MSDWALPDRADFDRFGNALGRRLRPGSVLALIGELGAGKTTLTQAIARGVGARGPVTSPTFGLVHEYPGPIPLFHFDTYRLPSAEDLMDLGFTEYFERHGIVVIEWADRFPELLPVDRITIRIEAYMAMDDGAGEVDGGEADITEAPRRITMTAEGDASPAVVRGLEEDPELQDLRAEAAPGSAR